MASIHYIIHHLIHSTCHPFTLSSIQHVINSPCHPFTMSSIHHVTDSPCHPYAMSFIHLVIGPISSFYLQVTIPEELHQKEFLVPLETTLARGASTLGKILLYLFFLCYLPLLLAPSNPPHSTINNIFPIAGAAKTYLYQRPLNYSTNLISNHGRNYVFALVVFDFILILNLVMPKINYITVVYSFLLIL